MAIKIERGINSPVNRAVPQMRIEAYKYPLHSFSIKGDIGKLLYKSKLGPHRVFLGII